MSKPPALPTAMPGGALMPFMSSRARHQVCDTVFEMIGGTQRLAAEADKDSDGFWEFMKLWGKGLPKMANTEHSVSEGVESLLEKLDDREAAENAKLINGTFIDVEG